MEKREKMSMARQMGLPGGGSNKTQGWLQLYLGC